MDTLVQLSYSKRTMYLIFYAAVYFRDYENFIVKYCMFIFGRVTLILAGLTYSKKLPSLPAKMTQFCFGEKDIHAW